MYYIREAVYLFKLNWLYQLSLSKKLASAQTSGLCFPTNPEVIFFCTIT